ncbi:hypothetical protein FC82_GL001067 [Secundilactobacillus collinoides DSM 20515 = JCM 1123]|uniref:Uncharacterized protein n=1 Tax=Secundilactobacillus collinoides DSM 20515 = JCM 1123 TaxID=1423733 RepID=A0A0R2BBC9_SECCO|nr:hypothetical protein FC82_GL001067 [Secundilactobacillus collinoides DSM 20515 = JCM 1123]
MVIIVRHPTDSYQAKRRFTMDDSPYLLRLRSAAPADSTLGERIPNSRDCVPDS